MRKQRQRTAWWTGMKPKMDDIRTFFGKIEALLKSRGSMNATNSVD
jgi:hypothetical protein